MMFDEQTFKQPQRWLQSIAIALAVHVAFGYALSNWLPHTVNTPLEPPQAAPLQVTVMPPLPVPLLVPVTTSARIPAAVTVPPPVKTAAATLAAPALPTNAPTAPLPVSVSVPLPLPASVLVANPATVPAASPQALATAAPAAPTVTTPAVAAPVAPPVALALVVKVAAAAKASPAGDIGVSCPQQVQPQMPSRALAEGVAGVVKAQALIKNGSVQTVTIVSGPRVFHNAVRSAMLQYRCVVDVNERWVEQTFNFNIE
jgi:periplasmic protein TonB